MIIKFNQRHVSKNEAQLRNFFRAVFPEMNIFVSNEYEPQPLVQVYKI